MASTILSDNGVSSGSAGIKTTADSTGALALQTTTAGGTATTALTIDTSQNVGIGTASPSGKLNVISGSVAQLIIGFSGTSASYLDSDSIVFRNAATSEAGRFTSTGLFQFNSGYGSSATAYGCRAWVNFNGTGTVAIRASGNVTSITDNNVGDYTINFTTSMPDANYSVVAMLRNTQTYAQIQVTAANIAQSTAPTTGAVRINTSTQGDAGVRANIDSDYVTAAIFR